MNLSANFTLEEMTLSEVAPRLALDNMPGPIETANLRQLAAFMETIRSLLGHKRIVVHSGYRSLQLNQAIGGVKTSAHCHGLACDFVCPGFGTPADVALAILNAHIEYDQLILEYGWVHVGLAQPGSACRRQALTKPSMQGGYEAGIHC